MCTNYDEYAEHLARVNRGLEAPRGDDAARDAAALLRAAVSEFKPADDLLPDADFGRAVDQLSPHVAEAVTMFMGLKPETQDDMIKILLSPTSYPPAP